MKEAKLREELHSFIDILPNRKLQALKPLLSALIEERIIIENSLTDQEKTIVTKGRKERKVNPQNFASWAKVRKS